jgi:hypothetical protein
LGYFSLPVVGGTGGEWVMEEDELMEVLGEMLEEWQVDVLIELIRRQPEWVAIGVDPVVGLVVGLVGDAPPDWTWLLN